MTTLLGMYHCFSTNAVSAQDVQSDGAVSAHGNGLFPSEGCLLDPGYSDVSRGPAELPALRAEDARGPLRLRRGGGGGGGRSAGGGAAPPRREQVRGRAGGAVAHADHAAGAGAAKPSYSILPLFFFLTLYSPTHLYERTHHRYSCAFKICEPNCCPPQ